MLVNRLNNQIQYLIEVDRAAKEQYEFENVQSPSAYLSGVREYATTDGYSYLVREASPGGRVCEKTGLPEDTGHYSAFTVIRLLQSITPGELLEKDVLLNGILADVYEIKDVSMLLVREKSKVGGKVWVAQEPRYFLKAEGILQGVFELENRSYTGEASFAYEMKDFGQVVVQLPAICANPPEELVPLPSNATDVRKTPPRIFFSSPDSAEHVRDYYLAQLSSQGWMASEAPSDGFGQVVQASITTPQDIQIVLNIRIHDMGAGGSSVDMDWQAR